jgi:hypothetical protein
MKKQLRFLTMFIASFLLMAGSLSAQTILCVDRDFGPSDVYTDTWPMISRALDAAGYTYDLHVVLDAGDNGPDATTMGEYDIVVWFTGEAWTDGETMGPDDEFNLLLYMTLGGGKLFLNAQDYLYDKYAGYGEFSSGEFPYDQLGVVNVEQDVYHIEDIPDTTGRFNGAPGSLAEGMSFPVRDIFTTVTDDGLYGDSIAEYLGDPLLTVVEPYTSPGPAAVQYETPDFRSVFTTIDIAAITDTVARNIFMHKIIDWLMYGATGIVDLGSSDAEIVVKPNPVVSHVEIGMTKTMDEVFIYNSQGQIVRHEKVGETSVRMDLGDLTAGVYILKVISGRSIITEKILKQ